MCFLYKQMYKVGNWNRLRSILNPKNVSSFLWIFTSRENKRLGWKTAKQIIISYGEVKVQFWVAIRDSEPKDWIPLTFAFTFRIFFVCDANRGFGSKRSNQECIFIKVDTDRIGCTLKFQSEVEIWKTCKTFFWCQIGSNRIFFDRGSGRVENFKTFTSLIRTIKQLEATHSFSEPFETVLNFSDENFCLTLLNLWSTEFRRKSKKNSNAKKIW